MEGAQPWRLLPRGFRAGAVTVAAGPPALALALILATAPHVSPAFFLPIFLPLFLSPLLVPMLVDRRLRRLADRVPLVRPLRGARPGDTIRVRGRIAPGPTFFTMAGRRPAVLATYVGQVEYVCGKLADGLPKGWWETRGLDFTIDLDTGESVKVAARTAYLMQFTGVFKDFLALRNRVETPVLGRFSAPLPNGGEVTYVISDETAVGPGDEVDVVGVLDQEVDPHASHGRRQIPMSPVLRGARLAPVIVRPLGRPEAG
jgi:hypothetical protein